MSVLSALPSINSFSHIRKEPEAIVRFGLFFKLLQGLRIQLESVQKDPFAAMGVDAEDDLIADDRFFQADKFGKPDDCAGLFANQFSVVEKQEGERLHSLRIIDVFAQNDGTHLTVFLRDGEVSVLGRFYEVIG